jgi:general stress protein YciG
MAGNKIGGHKTRETNYEKYGRDFYKKIGAIGGSRGSADGVTKGFASDVERARRAGQIGGKISKRGASKNK